MRNERIVKSGFEARLFGKWRRGRQHKAWKEEIWKAAKIRAGGSVDLGTQIGVE